MRQDQQPQRAGISTNTILLIGGAALAAFLIFRKKK
jgi:LPXTG-motif cell wall-anchored protein